MSPDGITIQARRLQVDQSKPFIGKRKKGPETANQHALRRRPLHQQGRRGALNQSSIADEGGSVDSTRSALQNESWYRNTHTERERETFLSPPHGGQVRVSPGGQKQNRKKKKNARDNKENKQKRSAFLFSSSLCYFSRSPHAPCTRPRAGDPPGDGTPTGERSPRTTGSRPWSCPPASGVKLAARHPSVLSLPRVLTRKR